LARTRTFSRCPIPPYYTACPNPFIEDFIKHYGKPYDPSVPYDKEPFAADVSEGKNDPIYNAHSYHTKVPHKAIMRYIDHYTKPGDLVFDGFCGTGMSGVAKECGWMFQTLHVPTEQQISSTVKEIESSITPYLGGDASVGRINYTLWSDVFTCPECAGELIFWDVAIDQKTNQVLDTFPCPHCGSSLTKDNVERSWVVKVDPILGKPFRQIKQIPALISYVFGRQKIEKKPDAADFALLARIDSFSSGTWEPSYPMMFKGEKWGDTWRHLR
jgi:predicted RNA-binding Zn-ribbon protein involved in translation (DUF1610 family)